MQWVYFLGRFHVLAVHLPIGIIYVTVVLELLVRRPRFTALAGAATYLWAAAAITAIASVGLGLAHSTEGGFNAGILDRHRALGISVALLATVLFFFRLKHPITYQKSQLFTGLLALALVAVTGHYGGSLTHGSAYLLEYAPPALQSLAGIDTTRKRPLQAADAEVFTDVIHPILQLRCGSCHGETTQKGALSFATYARTMQGGEDLPAVVPGDLKQSDLYFRVTLPHDSYDFMPRENKTPLTPDQIRIIAWWIQAGAPGKGSVKMFKPPADILKLIDAQLSSGKPH